MTSSDLPEQEVKEIFQRCSELYISMQKAKAEAEHAFDEVTEWLKSGKAVGYKDKKEAYNVMSWRINRYGDVIEARRIFQRAKHAFINSIRDLEDIQSEHGVNCTNEIHLMQGWLEETISLLELTNEAGQGYDMIVQSSQERHSFDINTRVMKLTWTLVALTIILVILTIVVAISS